MNQNPHVRRAVLAGLGIDIQQAGGAASMAASGAKLGTMILPGIGTVIGAVVGAVVGWLGGKKRNPYLVTADQIKQCNGVISEYMGFAAQMPEQAIPLDFQQLKDIAWCSVAVHGGQFGWKDTRFFAHPVEPILWPLAKQMVRKIYETPIGATIQLDEFSFKDPKGRTIRLKSQSFVNTQFVSIKDVAEKYFFPAMMEQCLAMPNQKPAHCDGFHAFADVRRWAFDFLALAARTELPNISEDDLKAASAVAVTVPGTSASAVVQAVEQVMGRTVERGETAALLTPATTAPPVAPTVPSTSPLTTPTPGIGPAPAPSQPVFSPPITLPEFPTMQPQPFTPFAPGESEFPIGIQPGKMSPPTTTAETTDWYENPWLIGGGLAALGFVFFARKRKA